VNYINGNGCTAPVATVYNVTVNPLPVPAIAGPAPVCVTSTGNLYTTAAGMTNYIWTVSAGGTITAGGTNTDNTVTVTWNTVGAQTVRVNYTNAFGCTATTATTYNVTVNALPAPAITGPSPVCVTSTGNVYTTESGMSNYLWSVSAGGTITAGGTIGDNTVTITWNTAGTQTVSVNYTNGNSCTAATPTSKTVIVNPLPVPAITGNAAACFNSTGNIYTTDASMTNYIWIVTGGTVTAGGTITDNSVTVTWNTLGAQSVSVNYTNSNGCTAAAPTVRNVTVNPLPAPTITGPASVCVNSTGHVYQTETLMTNYIWTVSAGGVITAGGTGNETVTVTWTTTGAKTVTVNYTNGNNCTAAIATVYNVTVNALPVPTIAGPSPVCVTSTGNLYQTEAGMTNYLWLVTGGTITAGGGTGDATATVTWNTAGSQTISVNYTNGNSCTAASATVRTITVYPLPVPTISGNGAACLNSTGNIYTTEAGMTNYTWVVTGGTVTAGGTNADNTATVTWTTLGAQSVSVNYTNGNNCTAAAPTVRSVTVNPLPVPTITGPAAACATSTGNVYSTEAGMSSYSWTVSAGGTITAGGPGVNTIIVTWNTAGAQTVSVNYINGNGCTAVTPATYNVTVNPLPVPAIAGPVPVCVTSTGNLYTTAAGMTNYIWTVSAGGTITAGGTVTDNTVTVTWSTVGSQTVSVNYTNGNGCTASGATVKNITVNALPVPTITGNAAACAASTGNLYTTEAGMTNYIWVVSAGGAITAGGTPANNSVTVTWNTVGAQSVSVNYTNANSCTATTATVKNVTVNPLPVPTITGNTPVCLNSTGNVYTTESGMTSYLWSVTGGIITGGGTTSSNTVTITWTTAGVQSVSVNYTNGNSCTAASPTVYNVTVNSLPLPSIGGPTPVCVASAGNVYTTQAGMTNYIWSVSSGGTITAGGTSADNTVTVTWNSQGMRPVSVNYTDANGCKAPAATTFNVTVNPLPVATISGGETICSGETSILKVNMTMGTGPYDLVINNLGAVNDYDSGDDIPVTPGVTTTYTLSSVTDDNGCTVTTPSNLFGSATVTVRTLPSITVEPIGVTTCEYGIVTFEVTATGTDRTYQWFENRGSGFSAVLDTGIYYGANMETLYLFGATREMDGYTYHVVVSNCTNSDQSVDVTLNVNTVPEIIYQPADTTVCSTNNAAFGVVATGTGLSYEWQVKIGASAFTPVVNGGFYSGQGTDSLKITGAAGSLNNNIYRVVVRGTCGAPVYSNFVILRVTVPPTVTVNPSAKAICDGSGTVYFIANGSGMIDSLRWQVNTGSGWNDIHDNVVYSGTMTQQLAVMNAPVSYNGYQFRLALKAACATTWTNAATLTVNALPVVSFATDPINSCGGVAQVLIPVITGGSGTWTQHTWTGDVGPLNNYFIQSPTFKTLIPDTYSLNYKVKDSNNCYGNKDVTVIVDSPDATFVHDVQNGCTPVTVSFTKDMTGISSWTWDFGDGTPVNITDQNPVHVFTNTTVSTILYRTVTLTVQSAGGCTATRTSMVTVYPAIDATFTASTNIICSGSTITFTALPGANNYSWDFGDGNIGVGSTPSHLYTNFNQAPEVHTVQLTTTSFYGCTDVKTLDITVWPVPAPQFSLAYVPDNTFNAAGNLVNFTNETNPGTWTYSWDFGDTGTSAATSPPHTYFGVGTYNVTLGVTNGTCTDSIVHQVNILPLPPIANFDSIPSGCSPLSVEFNNTSLNTDAPGTTYRWDFGDGSYSTTENPAYTYFTEGSYRVELTVTGPGGISIKSQVVNAYVSPKAYFEITPSLVFVNDERVRCFNLTQFADSYLWEFGDGDTSRMKEPYHKYMEEGVYDVTLWAYSNNGCSDKFVLSPAVTVEPAGEVRFSTVFTPNKEGPVERSDLPTGGTEIDQFFFPPIREKVINYKLQIFNRLGVLIFESRNINIPWNGYYKGQLCPQGVYVWYVEGKYANGMPFKKVGDVTLLH
jgi:PKD repeat protein